MIHFHSNSTQDIIKFFHLTEQLMGGMTIVLFDKFKLLENIWYKCWVKILDIVGQLSASFNRSFIVKAFQVSRCRSRYRYFRFISSIQIFRSNFQFLKVQSFFYIFEISPSARTFYTRRSCCSAGHCPRFHRHNSQSHAVIK